MSLSYFKRGRGVRRRLRLLKLEGYILIQKITHRYFLSTSDSYEYLMRRMNFIIQSGPFKGMKYINQSNGSVLFPKIVGTYDKPIHDIIRQLVNTSYDNYIDIGCAEGYYAVGLAHELQKVRNNFKVYAYDVDPTAITNLIALANLNDVLNFLDIGSLFQSRDFDKFTGKTVVICDIEGAELSLLDPSKSENLLHFDLLVEVHDGGKESNIIKDSLRNRFCATHLIEIIDYVDYCDRHFDFIEYSHEKQFMNEGRRYGLEWMWLKRKN